MKEEIAATVFFITRLAKRHGKLPRKSSERLAVELTAILFDRYRTHWYPENPEKGQAFRCMRMNKWQLRDPVLEQACWQSDVDYEDMGLPKEITIWVDPGEVCCRYGEKNKPFSVAVLDGPGEDREFTQRISSAVEKATSDYHSGTSSEEETSSVASGSTSPLVPKTIPTVSNPNSVYQFSDFSAPPAVQQWTPYTKRKLFQGDGYQHAPAPGYYPPHKTYKSYRASSAFSGPRVDRYHWVSKNRS
ncbi:protein BTG4 [Amia ocellicauda]|uniref:protein BTG4 n=1 Tax=Amia ocellicauda TaxID=2972642 RepID=UPI003463D187